MKIAAFLMLLILLAPPASYGDQTVTCSDKKGYKIRNRRFWLGS